jgi:hypothetical protein
LRELVAVEARSAKHQVVLINSSSLDNAEVPLAAIELEKIESQTPNSNSHGFQVRGRSCWAHSRQVLQHNRITVISQMP